MINKLIDQIGGRERLEQIKKSASSDANETVRMARALLAVLDAQEKPFMYAISDCDGQAHFEDACVSARGCDLDYVVDSLNEFRGDGDDSYSVVPVYTVPPAASAPDGWKLVPIDATRLMIDAARAAEEDGYDAMLKAMLAAAPAQGGDVE